MAGRRLTGLLASSTRVVAGEETGGPLVTLSGEVIGMDVSGAGGTGFAVPVNRALAIAKRLAGR